MTISKHHNAEEFLKHCASLGLGDDKVRLVIDCMVQQMESLNVTDQCNYIPVIFVTGNVLAGTLCTAWEQHSLEDEYEYDHMLTLSDYMKHKAH